MSDVDLKLVEITNLSAETAKKGQVIVRWLGQAGFEFFYNGYHFMIDPYLSDSLAKKYAGKEFAHERMMPVPFEPCEVEGLDYVLCTHRHSDHMDPETVPMLLGNNATCKLVASKAEKSSVEKLGLADSERLIFVNANESIALADDIAIDVISSAHEGLEVDDNGNHRYLGYIIHLGNMTIYHCGDCVPYDGLVDCLSGENIDFALLPVNGRDEFRSSRGVPGNFIFEEAISLCNDAGIRNMICHHFGMFDFNTVDEKWLRESAGRVSDGCFGCIVPDVGHYMVLKKD